MTLRRTNRIQVRVDEEQKAAIRARAEAAGAEVAPFMRDAAMNPAIETAAERRRAVTTLFGLRRELAGLVVLSREQWPPEEAAELRQRAWEIATRIDQAIDCLVSKGIAS